MSASDYTVRGSGAFAAVAELSADVGHLATSFSITNLSEPTPGAVVVGMAAMIDGEIVRVASVGSGTIGVARGCADTIPAEHLDGALIWFFSTAIGTDSREYAATQTITVKVLPRTAASSPVPIASSPPNEITFNSRFARPYPPGQMEAQGDAWFEVPDPIASGGSLDLTWVPRNRITQADVLVGHTEGAVTPEAGTTYTARVYSAANALLNTYAGLTGTSWSYDHADMLTDFAALLGGFEVPGYVLFSSVRDGYESWQAYRIDFVISAPLEAEIGVAHAVGLQATINGSYIACGVGAASAVGLPLEAGTAHRYWRLRDFTGVPGSFFETSEIELREGGVVRSGGIVPTASTAPTGNTIDKMTDGTLNANQMYWTNTVAATLSLTFDLGVARAIDSVRISYYDTGGRFPTACTLDYSDDGSTWVEVGTGAVVEPGTNYTFSPEIFFV
jgi:F5/8 type C domain